MTICVLPNTKWLPHLVQDTASERGQGLSERLEQSPVSWVHRPVRESSDSGLTMVQHTEVWGSSCPRDVQGFQIPRESGHLQSVLKVEEGGVRSWRVRTEGQARNSFTAATGLAFSRRSLRKSCICTWRGNFKAPETLKSRRWGRESSNEFNPFVLLGLPKRSPQLPVSCFAPTPLVKTWSHKASFSSSQWPVTSWWVILNLDFWMVWKKWGLSETNLSHY